MNTTSVTERIVGDKVVEIAAEMRNEFIDHLLKNIETVVANGVSRGMGGK